MANKYSPTFLDSSWDIFTVDSGGTHSETFDFTQQYTPKDFLLSAGFKPSIPIDGIAVQTVIQLKLIYDAAEGETAKVDIIQVPCTIGGINITDALGYYRLQTTCATTDPGTLSSVVVTAIAGSIPGNVEFHGITLLKNLENNRGTEELAIPTIGKDFPAFDEFGLNPEYIKYYPNKCFNSSFEIFDSVTLKPTYWDTDGVVSDTSAFGETYSLMLTPNQFLEQAEISGEGLNHPSFWSQYPDTRMTFRVKGDGAVRVRVLQDGVSQPLFKWTIDVEGVFSKQTGTFIDFDAAGDWPDAMRSFAVTPNPAGGRFKLRFVNIGTGTIYIDAVQIEADWNGRHPSLYSPGVNSTTGGVATGTEFMEYSALTWNSSGVTFTLQNAYVAEPIVTAGVHGVSTDFSSSSFVLIAENIKETVQGQSLYSKVKVTPVGTSVPSAPAGAKITLQAICSGKVAR